MARVGGVAELNDSNASAGGDGESVAELNGMPKLLKIRFLSNSADGTPKNRGADSEDEVTCTPLSGVSESASVFDRSCVSLMDDLSQSTITSPVQELRSTVVRFHLVLGFIFFFTKSAS